MPVTVGRSPLPWTISNGARLSCFGESNLLCSPVSANAQTPFRFPAKFFFQASDAWLDGLTSVRLSIWVSVRRPRVRTLLMVRLLARGGISWPLPSTPVFPFPPDRGPKRTWC